jgi:hypothetical protein
LDRLAGDEQERCLSGSVTEDLAHVSQRLAQIGASHRVGLVGPKQSDEGFTTVRPVGFDDQVNQQGTRFVGFNACQRLSVEQYLQWPQ